MRLIDADVLRARLEGMMKAPWNAQSAPYCWAHAYEAMQEELDKAPTVEAEPVVLCRDCRHYNTHGCHKGFGWCGRNGAGSAKADEWFCEAWEKKGE